MRLPGESVTFTVTRRAAAALMPHRFVRLKAGDPEQIQLCGSNESALGIVGFEIETGSEATIKCGGHLIVEAGTIIVAGDEIICGVSGTAIKRGTSATTRYNVLGRALCGASIGQWFILAFGPYTVFGANAS